VVDIGAAVVDINGGVTALSEDIPCILRIAHFDEWQPCFRRTAGNPQDVKSKGRGAGRYLGAVGVGVT
jgi:hypothetical protein